jgi:hypothetical protein
VQISEKVLTDLLKGKVAMADISETKRDTKKVIGRMFFYWK